MKKLSFLIAIAVLVFVGFACDGMSRIGGKVVDSNGLPIENASVLFEAVEKGEPKGSYESSVRTSADGTFGCGFVHAPWNVKLRLTVEKDGYAKYVRELYSNDVARSPGGNMGFQIIMLDRP